MRYVGKITDWNDERGYGFVTPNGGGERAFIHIKEFESRTKRPSTGMLVSYEALKDSKNRLNAVSVQQVALGRNRDPSTRIEFPRKTISIAFFVVLILAVVAKSTPVFVLVAYAVMSAITYLIYASDKSAALHKEWRTQESTLHLLSFACGWPGALIAQDRLRHKSRKTDFQFTFWITVAANIAAFVWLVRSGKLAWVSDLVSAAN